MSQLVNYSGDEEICHGGSIYSNPKEAGLFLSVGCHSDFPYFPRKRARVSAEFVFSGERFENKKQASIDILPDECLFEIFKLLPGGEERSVCACVSKRWLMLLSSIPRAELSSSQSSESNRVGGDAAVDCVKITTDAEDLETESDGFLTRTLDGKKATDVRLAAIAVGTDCRGGLGKLVIRGSSSSHGATDLGLRAIARCCPSLRAVSLWNLSSIGDEGLIEIASRCRRLEKLDLCKCLAVSDKALLSIAKNCPNLTTLTIESCPNVGNEGLQAVGQHCPNLKFLSIKDCPLVGDKGIASVLSSATNALTKLKLQELNITDLSLAIVGHYGKVVTDLVLASLPNVTEQGFWVMGNAHGLQKLKTLSVTSCRGVTDRGLEALGKGCPNLKIFYLRKCAFLSDSGLTAFARAAISLENLQLEECHRITQIGFFSLLLNCGAKLKALSMMSCFGIKDMAFGVILPDCFTSLQSLSICNCPGFGNINLVLLAKLCPQLQYVDLSGLHGITDAGFLPMIDGCNAGLVKVNLSGCINVTDEVVLALTKLHGGTLETLFLDGCGKVTDASLVAIAENCLVITDLDVSKCAITDLGIISLARSNQLNLQIFSLSGCLMVSDKSLPYLVKLGQTLVGLNLQHCNAISSTAVGMLVERLWKCDILS
ncbi:hypothetical protein Nepgr_012681 [Nepenthes gracilis]|uniref:F-box domain-containing protein n=1 Tax=Nepenthes gracilis TaxID=150966 RepID=A0AAD3SHC1_NEPGR|nr:hypothetical protein Nepgr_012681 [Nepenthes gracilis]